MLGSNEAQLAGSGGVRDPFLAPQRSRLSPDPARVSVDVATGVQDNPLKAARVGSLAVVGTGIMVPGQVTVEAQRLIEQADLVLYLVDDPVTERWIQKLNRNTEALSGAAAELTPQGFEHMVERTLESVRGGLSVCAAYYGHPAICGYAAHESIARCRAEGYRAMMAPAVSVEDCLFADVDIDPAVAGCQMHEATNFLVQRRRPDVSSALLLWRVGRIGETAAGSNGDHVRHLRVLVETLSAWYGPDHDVVLYEPAPYPVCDPVIQRFQLGQLAGAPVTAMSVLYVPPKDTAEADPEMLRQLGLGG